MGFRLKIDGSVYYVVLDMNQGLPKINERHSLLLDRITPSNTASRSDKCNHLRRHSDLTVTSCATKVIAF